MAGALTTTGAFNTTLIQQASVSLTLPPTTDTLVGRATTDTLTNKTLTAPTINGATIATSTYNGNTITTGTGVLTLGAGKTLTASNTLTFTGTDGSSVNFGTGGTVLYTNASISLTGDVTGSGTTSIATTVAKIAGVNVGTPTGTGNVVMSASPTLSGTVGGALTFSGALTLSSALTYGGVTLSNAVTGTGAMVLAASPTISGLTVTGSFTATGLVANASLANSSITLGSTAMVLGSTTSTIAGAITWSGAAVFSSTVATGALTVTGAITATGNITAFFSDDRLKTRLGVIEDPLGKVLSLHGFYYEPNETALKLGYHLKRDVALSAQDVQAIMPEVVAPAPIDHQYLTLRYERMVPLLVEAIKALKFEIDLLKAAA